MANNLQKLKPIEVCRLLNSTPLGTVVGEQTLRNHRTQAGLTLGTDRHVNLLAYTAWLLRQRHEPRVHPRRVPDVIDWNDTVASALALVRTSPAAATLSPSQHQAVALMMTHTTHKAVAEAVGVRPNTLCRWLQIPAFRTAREEVQRALYETLYIRAQGCIGLVFDRLIAIADHAPRPSDRIRACLALATLADRGRRRHSTPPPATPPLQPADVRVLLSSFVTQAAASDLPINEKTQIIERLIRPLMNAIDSHDLQIRLEEIEDVLQTHTPKE